MRFSLFLALILCLGMADSHAKLLQIIHTNDLHSFFNGTRNGRGGYAKIKTLVNRLKTQANQQGIKTLFLDAGDFGEGSSFYFSDRGADSMRALDLLGVDFTVLGNHDYILGGLELARQLETSELKAPLLSANLKGKKKMNLVGKVPDFADVDLDGLKVRIMGLSTPELHYQYPLRPQGSIKNAVSTGLKLAHRSQKEGVDLLIALTHIGLKQDIKLAESSRTIDLIIGGHSHTRLETPRLVENLEDETVPIFQTGAHGIAVGSLLIDVQGEGEFKLIDYKLHDITQDLEEDSTLKKFTQEAQLKRSQYFQRDWDEIIGFSEINLTGFLNGKVRETKSCWSQHVARLTKLTAKAELGLQMDLFLGEQISAGPVRFGDMIDNFPHFRHWGDQGWNVVTVKVSGLILKQIIKLMNSETDSLDLTIDGLTTPEGRPFVGNLNKTDEARINGEVIKNFKRYTVGVPSEVPLAIQKTLPILGKLLLHEVESSQKFPFWEVLEDYIRKNSPLRCLE